MDGRESDGDWGVGREEERGVEGPAAVMEGPAAWEVEGTRREE